MNSAISSAIGPLGRCCQEIGATLAGAHRLQAHDQRRGSPFSCGARNFEVDGMSSCHDKQRVYTLEQGLKCHSTDRHQRLFPVGRISCSGFGKFFNVFLRALSAQDQSRSHEECVDPLHNLCHRSAKLNTSGLPAKAPLEHGCEVPEPSTDTLLRRTQLALNRRRSTSDCAPPCVHSDLVSIPSGMHHGKAARIRRMEFSSD